MAEAQQDVDTLKRRGRRRLVGAVALVLLAVIILPMVFDPEPRNAPQVSVRIPGEDEGAFQPKPQVKPAAPAPAAPVVQEKKPEPAKPESKSEDKKAAARSEPKPAQKKPEPKSPDAERARAEAALANAEFMVPVGAFANPDPVIAKLAAAKVRYYTEKVATAQGTVTRVRAGPFASKAEAEKALQALKKLGLSPGNVSAKS
ncbi:MAG TPA: SPOR domain-containing protein [Burkholderiales bacterium]|jgi:DedD protein